MKQKLGFSYSKPDYNFIATYKNGSWDEGHLRTEDTFTIPMMASTFHYGQQAFEGMKAYKSKDDKVLLFRIKDNAKRFARSCKQLVMPPVDEDFFMEAVKKTVLANQHMIPPYGSESSLYIRPFMIGSGHVLGLKAAEEYTFAILVTSVGPYFPDGL